MTSSAFAESLRARLGRFGRARRGSAAVEFAITAPVMIMLIIGILMLGVAYFHVSTIQWSFERAVRLAMIDSAVTVDDIEAAMADDLARIGSPDVDLTYTLDDSGAAPLAIITANFAIPLSIPFLPTYNLQYTIEDVVPVPND